jgi:hypothetical protein
VKQLSADDSAPAGVKVGHRQSLILAPPNRGAFCWLSMPKNGQGKIP